MNTPDKANLLYFSRVNNKQHGITLIMVLIFIVTLSLIAAVGMRGVITGDRVVANERDRSIAFQGAESAGREAVKLIATKNGANFHARTMFPLGGNIEHWRTTSALEASDCLIPLASSGLKRYDWVTERSAAKPDCSTRTAEKYDNAEAPRYVIEFTSEVPNTATAKKECWYRVTSRATGRSGEADVILQVMFAVEHQNLPSDPCINDALYGL